MPLHQNAVEVDQDVCAQIEHALDSAYLSSVWCRYIGEGLPTPTWAMTRMGVPAPVIRVDMPPPDPEYRGVYEIDANPSPSGLELVDRLGIPISRRVAESLLAHGVEKLVFGTTPSQKGQAASHERFVRALKAHGITPTPLSTASYWDAHGVPVWLCAGQEDMKRIAPLMGSCLTWLHGGGGEKSYLIDIDGAFKLSGLRELIKEEDILDDASNSNLSDVGLEAFRGEVMQSHLLSSFPNGFVVKPLNGWEGCNTKVFATIPPWKNRAHGAREIQLFLAGTYYGRHDTEFIVQRFIPPTYRDDYFRTWQLYAVWLGEGYRVVGGFWEDRQSLRLLGANNTVLGPLIVPGM